MINEKHLIKVGLAWISIVYVICFAGVALWPSLRTGFMKYALHSEINLGQNYLNFSSFIIGLIVWNLAAAIGFWLFAVLFNKIKQ
ncbi:MAG: hypothetical protein A3B04_02585 [Candidatus Portnoybacteria bacterium RIFCSPLOWO2_02_FULL_39_11]|uniref:Uncharacterized protein n=1 Tax=Candidatus Portnoybacteria bacterium RIFCSPLOWO2_02_FULL_39_11 TaxID=1802001 RepID=A0A1G2FVH5_9BACT|nr:MAG: hypothetical protein A3B04_02585 [Candidatus Portnoybacteria bacterium RIFCSPLOWO2_02_FULL_39_11]